MGGNSDNSLFPHYHLPKEEFGKVSEYVCVCVYIYIIHIHIMCIRIHTHTPPFGLRSWEIFFQPTAGFIGVDDHLAK